MSHAREGLAQNLLLLLNTLTSTKTDSKTFARYVLAALAFSACGSSAKKSTSDVQPDFTESVERVDLDTTDDPASEAISPISPQDIVYFSLDSSTLSELAGRDPAAVATWMHENPQRYVVVDAHTDEQGSEAFLPHGHAGAASVLRCSSVTCPGKLPLRASP